jgi:multidrug/hemolysin transport system ATP-binding protein
MEEAAEADFVVIIDSGKISAEGTPLELKNTYTGDFITMYGIDEAVVKKFGYEYEPIRDAYRVSVPNTKAATDLIIKYPDVFVDYEITKGKMDDVFLSVTGKKLVGGAEK